MYTTLHFHNTQLWYNTIIIIKFLRIEDVSCLWRKCSCYNSLGGARHVFPKIFEIWYTPLFFLICFFIFSSLGRAARGGRGARTVPTSVRCAGPSYLSPCANFTPLRWPRFVQWIIFEMATHWVMHARPFSFFPFSYTYWVERMIVLHILGY